MAYGDLIINIFIQNHATFLFAEQRKKVSSYFNLFLICSDVFFFFSTVSFKHRFINSIILARNWKCPHHVKGLIFFYFDVFFLLTSIIHPHRHARRFARAQNNNERFFRLPVLSKQQVATFIRTYPLSLVLNFSRLESLYNQFVDRYNKNHFMESMSIKHGLITMSESTTLSLIIAIFP